MKRPLHLLLLASAARWINVVDCNPDGRFGSRPPTGHGQPQRHYSQNGNNQHQQRHEQGSAQYGYNNHHPQRRQAPPASSSDHDFSEGNEDGSIYDVDFYDNLHSEFAREIEADLASNTYGAGSGMDGYYGSGGDDQGHGQDGDRDEDGRPYDEAPTFDNDHLANGKEEMYAAYNELHNLAQGTSLQMMTLLGWLAGWLANCSVARDSLSGCVVAPVIMMMMMMIRFFSPHHVDAKYRCTMQSTMLSSLHLSSCTLTRCIHFVDAFGHGSHLCLSLTTAATNNITTTTGVLYRLSRILQTVRCSSRCRRRSSIVGQVSAH